VLQALFFFLFPGFYFRPSVLFSVLFHPQQQNEKRKKNASRDVARAKKRDFFSSR